MGGQNIFAKRKEKKNSYKILKKSRPKKLVQVVNSLPPTPSHHFSDHRRFATGDI
jgi:hypothetical protein